VDEEGRKDSNLSNGKKKRKKKRRTCFLSFCVNFPTAGEKSKKPRGTPIRIGENKKKRKRPNITIFSF